MLRLLDINAHVTPDHVPSTSIPFLLRWYYVNPVLTSLSLGPYYVL